MSRHHQHARALLFLLIANLSLWIQVSSLYAAYPHTVGQTWTQCLDTAAKRIQINPVLLHAIVHTESREHPWAFGWTDREGIHHSWYATSLPQARAMFAHLSRIQAHLPPAHAHFDVGLTQLNSRNITRLARQFDIRPVEVLDPCVNLTFSTQILEEQLDRHGYTWQAIAGYNGSTSYIPLVWTNLCRVHPYPDCPAAGALAARPHPPAPTDPLRLTRATPLSFTTEDTNSSALGDPQPLPLPQPGKPLQEPRSPSSVRHPSSETTDLSSLLVKSLVPFCVLIATVVVISLGLRIILWALRGVRTSYLLLKAVRMSSPDVSPRDFKYTNTLRHTALRVPRN